MDNSSVSIGPGGASFNGPDGVRLFGAITLRSALKLHKIGIKVNRHTTNKILFMKATAYTGKTYKRGEFDRAMSDLTAWIDAMRSAIPVTIHPDHQIGTISVDGKVAYQ